MSGKLNRLGAVGASVVTALILFTPAAHASLIGTTVDITSGGGFFLQAGGCSGLTVDSNVECRIGDSNLPDDDAINIDIRDSSIVFEFIEFDGGGVFTLER